MSGQGSKGLDFLGRLAKAAISLDEEELGNAVADALSEHAQASSTNAADAKPSGEGQTSTGCGFDDPAIGRCVKHVDGMCTLESKR